MNIAIIGSGIVGSRIGKGFEKLGHTVIFYDINEKLIKELSKEHNATLSLGVAIMGSQMCFVCVPTPYTTKFEDKYIISVIKEISKILNRTKKDYLVVIKSTIIPTLSERKILPILTKNNKNVRLCMNPEFLTEISDSWINESEFKRDFNNEDRIIIGESDKLAGDILEELYKPLNTPIFRTDLTSAELIKYANNCALASRISYWNEIFLICKKIGLNGVEIARIVGLDPRIGKYGTINGKAFGGKCLPKDLKAFIDFSKKYHTPLLLKSIDKINEEMKVYGVRE